MLVQDADESEIDEPRHEITHVAFAGGVVHVELRLDARAQRIERHGDGECRPDARAGPLDGEVPPRDGVQQDAGLVADTTAEHVGASHQSRTGGEHEAIMPREPSPPPFATHAWGSPHCGVMTMGERGYWLGGMVVRSPFELPGVPAADPAAAADLTIVDSRGTPPPAGDTHEASPDGRRVRIVGGVGRFLVEDGARVLAWPDDDIEPGTLAQWLTGPVLAVAAMQRGRLVLHGAVIRIGSAAVVVLAHSGVGKSTMATACAGRGHAVLADDIAVVDADGDHPRVHAHAPVVRLYEPPSGVDVRASWVAADKRAYALPAHASGPVRIAALVALDDGDFACARLAAGAAAMELVRYSFCRPLLVDVQHALHLRQCAHLASCVPVWTLRRPRELTALPAVVDALEGIVAEPWRATLARVEPQQEIRR